MKISQHPLTSIIIALSILLKSLDTFSQDTDIFDGEKPLNNYEIQFTLSQRFHQSAKISNDEGVLGFKSIVFSDRAFALQLTKRAPNQYGWQMGINNQSMPYIVSVTYDSQELPMDLFDLGTYYVSVYGGGNYTHRFKHHLELISSTNLGLSIGRSSRYVDSHWLESQYPIFYSYVKSQALNGYVDVNFVFRKMFPFYSIGVATGVQYLFLTPFKQDIHWVETVDTNFTLTARKFSVPFSVVFSRNLCSKKSTLYTHGGYWD